VGVEALKVVVVDLTVVGVEALKVVVVDLTVVTVVDLTVVIVVIVVTAMIVVIVVVMMVVVVASKIVGVAAVGEAREVAVVGAGSTVATGPLTWKMRGTSPLLGDPPLSRSCDNHVLFLEYGLHDAYLLESICLNALKMASMPLPILTTC
jgi:hypothetical protein